MARPYQLTALADKLAREIRKVGASADSEEDVRVNVELVLRPAMQKFGLEVNPRFEQGIPKGAVASGRADAVYGAVYIEYKRPGRLESTQGHADAVQQVQDYLTGATRGDEPGRRQPRLVGVAIDGRRIVFVRPRGPRGSALDYYHRTPAYEAAESAWAVTEALPITRESIGQLFLYLRALAREPLTASGLAKVFGPESSLGPALVGAFYRRLTAPSKPLVATLFAEWDRLFGIVYGQDVARAEKATQVLGQLYGVARPDLKRLFFAVHTYYALVMKLLAVQVASLQQGSYITSFVDEVVGLGDAAFDRKLEALEDGSEFRRLEITNYLEGDFFRWYLAVWDKDLRDLLRTTVQTLDGFEPTSAAVSPELARDILKHLYQYLVPKQLRHDLGEYYTPDWLADFLLDEAGYRGDPSVRVLDPACGSGTFLALAIARVLDFADEKLLDERGVAGQVVRNIVGFDLNPLAVLAARTTYLLSLGHLLRYVRPLEIPVYLCDSILLPQPQRGGLLSQGREMTTSVGPFIVPGAIDDPTKMARFADALERAVRGEHALDGLIRTVERNGVALDVGDRDLLTELYRKLLDLAASGRNGIWPRLIKNAFAPLFVSRERFDLVVGNPPWVNWESLSDEYRRATLRLWREYGLFSLSGHEARLGGGKKDLSMLMLYVSAHNYLRPHGTLAFLVTQTLFKTAGAGAGFRRFRLPDSTPLGVRVVHDMTALQPFEGATNRTAAALFERDAETLYPVRWVVWRTRATRRPRTNAKLSDVLARTSRNDLIARPVRSGDLASPWLTTDASAAPVEGAIGKSAYRGYTGAYTGGLDGAFWIKVLAERTDGHLLIRNLHDTGKIEVERVEAVIEPDLVYPLLRGRDVHRWRARPSVSIILAQDPDTRNGFPEAWLRSRLALTHEYLARFEAQLRRRAAFRKYFSASDPFYSMYNVGPYTLAPWKTVWRQQAVVMTAAVVGPLNGRPVIPNHKLTLVPAASEDEAHFICAVLNSGVVRRIVAGYALPTGMTAHILDHVRIPRFDPNDALHQGLADFSRRATAGQAVIDTQLDDLVNTLWAIP